MDLRAQMEMKGIRESRSVMSALILPSYGFNYDKLSLRYMIIMWNYAYNSGQIINSMW